MCGGGVRGLATPSVGTPQPLPELPCFRKIYIARTGPAGLCLRRGCCASPLYCVPRGGWWSFSKQSAAGEFLVGSWEGCLFGKVLVDLRVMGFDCVPGLFGMPVEHGVDGLDFGSIVQCFASDAHPAVSASGKPETLVLYGL